MCVSVCDFVAVFGTYIDIPARAFYIAQVSVLLRHINCVCYFTDVCKLHILCMNACHRYVFAWVVLGI